MEVEQVAPKRKRGRPAKSLDQHVLDGTYRATRHKPIPKPLTLVKPRVTRLPSKRESMKFVRNVADERAVANGCRFSEERAAFFLAWTKKYLRLGEGRWAGRAFVPMDWQREEIFYPLFGWVRRHADHRQICRRFTRVYCEVPKKNGKSPMVAITGTYMMAGDGEQGAKCYSVATSKDQANIIHDHALHMVEDAPALKALCKFNRTTRHIYYTPNRAVYQVLSSLADKQDGLNASFLGADELHAWKGDILYNSLRYAFRSRLEPIFFQITTAGDDMDSVCRQQHDYALGVRSGDIEDDSYLGLIYAADPEDDWTKEEAWAKANPSLDHIVMRSDLRFDAEEARKSPRLVSAFKRYTLNVWATAESPWLDMDEWSRCRMEYGEADLLGEPCYAGLDLSMSRDLTAFVLMFPRSDGTYRQLAYFWMPEDTVKNRSHLANYNRWVERGFIETTPGNQIEYEFVLERIVELSRKFNLLEVAYDPYYATYFCQQLEEGHGITRVVFRQGMQSFAEPTSEYERLVGLGDMHHDGNPVLAWQAGHCTVKSDENKNIRPVKRKRGDYRTIDGVVAAVMALARAMAAVTPETDNYANRGFIRL